MSASRYRSLSLRTLRGQSGFTIPELLVVIGFITVCVVVSAFILQPTSYEAQELQAERRTHVARLVTALSRYRADAGVWPGGITTQTKILGNDEGYVDVCGQLVPKYINDIPLDPVAGAKLTADGQDITDQPCNTGILYDSGFQVALSKDGNQVTVIAPSVLDYAEVRVTR